MRWREYLQRRVEKLIPVLLCTSYGQPEVDLEQVSAFSREFLSSGTPAFRLLYFTLILVLEGLCMLRLRRPLQSLALEQARDFLESIYSSRTSLLKAVPLLLSAPFYLAHYGREDVQEALGFPVSALQEEAAKREVTR